MFIFKMEPMDQAKDLLQRLNAALREPGMESISRSYSSHSLNCT